MAIAKNTFIKSRMNKDLDARIIPKGEYRDAYNVQVSRSEGDAVGSLENVLGNSLEIDFGVLTGVSDLTCIGYFSDDINNNIYLFLTNYTDSTPSSLVYSTTGKNYIYSYNTITKTPNLLVKGAFLNFSKTHSIYATNVIEDLLFWTDNRNQPRSINIVSALSNPSHYTTEDQISVAKFSPFRSPELFRESLLGSTSSALTYETTMFDVTSKYYPNGGSTKVTTAASYTGGTDIAINGSEGYIYVDSIVTSNTAGVVIPANTKVTQISPLQLNNTIDTSSSGPETEIIFEANPYYDSTYNGDPNYLEDKFVRFSYRFNYEDGENSIFAPFTQPAFIPKQDGYFITSIPAGETIANNDEKQTYQSTVVDFMENKVNKILLYIPLPFKNYELQGSLKVSSIDVLYKESDGLAVKVIEEVPIETIYNSAARAQVNGAVSPPATTFNIDNIQGGIQVGALVTGGGVGNNITVVNFTPTDPSNPVAGSIELSDTVVLADDVTIEIGDTDYFIYDYQSRKPFRTLPDADLTRVYDQAPVRALAQEVASNRVIYGNFQNKHTPPSSLDYNVNSSQKGGFYLNEGTGTVSGGVSGASSFTITPDKGDIWSTGNVVGAIVTTNAIGATIPDGTLVSSYDSGTGAMTLTNNITISASDILIFAPGSTTQNTTSIIEYPNHSVKENRNYQIGIVLSDRYGRQSSVILSRSTSSVIVDGSEYTGATIFSPYGTLIGSTWPGDSLKISFNSPIGPSNKNVTTGWPGLYNGDPTSAKYNPLGWYSWKVVVKQTEQEYYNVYLPGIMAAYPEDTTLELGKTSHTVLFNDNINKVPRDLSEVGPEQRQFRSSVNLYGRVENIPLTGDDYNIQYYPGIKPDTASVISTLVDLFDLNLIEPPRPNYYPQFYNFETDPLIT